jgi:hypothetical protein
LQVTNKLYHNINIRNKYFLSFCVETEKNWFRFGLWYLVPLSTVFQLYLGGQLYWGRKLEKTNDLPQVTFVYSLPNIQHA